MRSVLRNMPVFPRRLRRLPLRQGPGLVYRVQARLPHLLEGARRHALLRVRRIPLRTARRFFKDPYRKRHLPPHERRPRSQAYGRGGRQGVGGGADGGAHLPGLRRAHPLVRGQNACLQEVKAGPLSFPIKWKALISSEIKAFFAPAALAFHFFPIRPPGPAARFPIK